MNQEETLTEILKEIRAMREDLALTLAVKRKQAGQKSIQYIAFEKWALEKKFFDTSMITGKFSVCKQTALNWMNKFVYEYEEKGFMLKDGFGQEPHRIFKKK